MRSPLFDSEVQAKLDVIREALKLNFIAGVRFRGVDWFSWITGGGNSVVILTHEAGIADVLVTPTQCIVLTNAIEKDRLIEEELPDGYPVHAVAWQDPQKLDEYVRDVCEGEPVASDRPQLGEIPLPAEILAAKRRLLPIEIERYRDLGRDAALAMTSTLMKATPEWTEFDLAAEGASALWKHGIHPTLTLVGGESRVSRHRHPFPTAEKLGSHAMLVFCARRFGLYANFTRWIYFKKPTETQLQRTRDAAEVEAVALQASRPGASLSSIYESIVKGYQKNGYSDEHLKHHQGGTTGYLSREVVATPHTSNVILEAETAVAWNPSLVGAKIEDTILIGKNRTEVLTVDPDWPTFEVNGLQRPDLLVKI
ncbi:MAG: M24 family metallopeptidase [Methylotenera sp.]|nr:M24 family metallopeptidase [Oligoflexia bacterium]